MTFDYSDLLNFLFLLLLFCYFIPGTWNPAFGAFSGGGSADLSNVQKTSEVENDAAVSKNRKRREGFSPYSIKRVAIVGGGPAGLTAAACLRRLGSEVPNVTVFEAKAEENFSGGHGVVIMGGLKVFEFLGILEDIIGVGFPIDRMTATNTYGMDLFEFPVHEILRKSKNPNLVSSAESGGYALAHFYSRGGILKGLLGSLEKNSFNKFFPKEIQEKTTVQFVADSNVVDLSEYQTPEGRKVRIHFADGRTEDGFDIVLGCDGAQSKIKEYIRREAYAEDPTLDRSEDDLAYCGIRVSVASTAADPQFKLREPRGPRQWYGDGIYVMEATVGGIDGPEHFLGISYATKEDSRLGENTKWSNGSNAVKEDLRNILLSKGFGRHKKFMKIFENTERVIELGVRANPKPLRSWHSKSGRVILAGDSAHKMAPYLGQGLNQAVQDAYVISKELIAANELYHASPADLDAAIIRAGENYETIRKAFTQTVVDSSSVVGKISTFGGFPGAVIVKSILVTLLFRLGVTPKKALLTAIPKFE